MPSGKPNSYVNSARHKIHGGGEPKDTSAGMDLGPKATNVIGRPHLSKAESPNSSRASRTNNAR